MFEHSLHRSAGSVVNPRNGGTALVIEGRDRRSVSRRLLYPPPAPPTSPPGLKLLFAQAKARSDQAHGTSLMDIQAAKRFQTHVEQAINELSSALLLARDTSSEEEFLAVQSIDSTVFRAVRMCFVFVCASMLWIFFKLPNFDHAVSYLSGMFILTTNPNPPKLFRDLALLYILPVIIQHFVSCRLFERKLRGLEPFLYGAMTALTYLEAGPETSFIYFQF
jgi:hypothetical protein